MSNLTQKERKVYSEGVLDGIKAERVRAMTARRGCPWCEKCGKTVLEAHAGSGLHLHHDEQRSLTYRANPFRGNFGGDDPLNLRLLCPGCHAQVHDEAAEAVG
jgi:hypothetical protein